MSDNESVLASSGLSWKIQPVVYRLSSRVVVLD